MGASVISTMNTLFWICLSFTVLFFIISVVMFFVFDIRTIFNIKTGRAQAKTVKEMKAANESTGRLRVAGKTQTSKLTESEKNASRVQAVTPPSKEEKSNYYNSGSDETELLKANEADSSYQAPAQEQTFAETSVLSENQISYTDDIGYNSDEKQIGFKVIKKSLYVHTNEMI